MSKVTEALELHQRWIEERRKADATDAQRRELVSKLTLEEKDFFWSEVERMYPND